MRRRRAFRLDIRFADKIHPARIAMKPVLDNGHVDIDGVPGLQDALPRDTVANHVIDRSADRLRKAPVVERGRNCVLYLGDMPVTDSVQLRGGHPRA